MHNWLCQLLTKQKSNKKCRFLGLICKRHLSANFIDVVSLSYTASLLPRTHCKIVGQLYKTCLYEYSLPVLCLSLYFTLYSAPNSALMCSADETIPPESENQDICLVLGSEGQGLTPVAKRSCTPISIPMDGQMDSLNVAVAGGILMYAVK